MNTSARTSLATPQTNDVHVVVHIVCRANCAASLCWQIMKSMRPMRRAYSPRISGETQQKDGHQKTIIARSATAVRRPAGVVFFAGLNARHDRFLLPTAAVRLPRPHTRHAYACRLCELGAGKRASRRAPTGFAGLHANRSFSDWPVHNRYAILNGFGSFTCVNRAGRPTRKAGGRAPLRSLAGGALPPTIRPRLGALESLGRFLGCGSPQRMHVPAGAGPLWRTAGAPVPASHRTIRSLVPRLSAVSPTAGATAPAPLVSSLRAASGLPSSPRKAARGEAQRASIKIKSGDIQ